MRFSLKPIEATGLTMAYSGRLHPESKGLEVDKVDTSPAPPTCRPHQMLKWVPTSNVIDVNHHPSNIQIRISIPSAGRYPAMLTNPGHKDSPSPAQEPFSEFSNQCDLNHQENQQRRLVNLVRKRLNKIKETGMLCLPTLLGDCPKIAKPKAWQPHFQAFFEPMWIDIRRLMTSEALHQEAFEGIVEAVRNAPEPIISSLVGRIKPELKQLLAHPSVSPLIQQLVCRSKELVLSISELMDTAFDGLVTNEPASRVLQAVVSFDPTFRIKVVSLLEHKWNRAISSLPGVYLICCCISTSNGSRDIDWIYDRILENCPRFLTSKYQKKILLHLLEFCSAEQQAEVCKFVLFPLGLPQILRDKHLSMILVSLVGAGCAIASDFLADGLQYSLEEVSQASCFSFVMTRCNLGKASIKLVDKVYHICLARALDKHPITQTSSSIFLNFAAACCTAYLRLSPSDMETFLAKAQICVSMMKEPKALVAPHLAPMFVAGQLPSR